MACAKSHPACSKIGIQFAPIDGHLIPKVTLFASLPPIDGQFVPLGDYFVPKVAKLC
jgi:hypothetical protein